MSITMNEYEQQAQDFLDKHGLTVGLGDPCMEKAPWGDECKHGARWTVTIRRHDKSMEFPFWASLADLRAGIMSGRVWSVIDEGNLQHRLQGGFDWAQARKNKKADAGRYGKTPTAYDILACISGDAHYHEMAAEEFFEEMGIDETPIKAIQTYERCRNFSLKMVRFFTGAELEELAEIQ